MRYVVFDSSFLMAVLERPTTWYEDMVEQIGRFTPVMVDRIADELEELASRGGKRARFAGLARELGSAFTMVRGGRGGSPDDEVLSWAASNHALVATVDRQMIEHLKASRLGYVTLRSGRVYIP